MTSGQVVQDRHVDPRRTCVPGQVGADEPGASGDQQAGHGAVLSAGKCSALARSFGSLKLGAHRKLTITPLTMFTRSGGFGPRVRPQPLRNVTLTPIVAAASPATTLLVIAVTPSVAAHPGRPDRGTAAVWSTGGWRSGR